MKIRLCHNGTLTGTCFNAAIQIFQYGQTVAKPLEHMLRNGRFYFYEGIVYCIHTHSFRESLRNFRVHIYIFVP